MEILMLESQSATIKFEQLPEYSWYTFEGNRSKKFKVRNHEAKISSGTVYGLKPIKGGRYYLILPEAWHIAYTISEREHEQLVVKSKRKRRMPPIEDVRAGRKRAKRVSTKSNEIDKASSRWKPTGKVPRESKSGVDFENYQWRKLNTKSFRYNKTRTKGFSLENGAKFGLRFLKQARGGMVVFEDGEHWNIPSDVYDQMVADSKVLPLNQWLKGKLSVAEIKQLQERKVENQKQRDKKEREEERERIRQAKEEERRRIRREKLEQREKEKEQARKVLNQIPKAPKVLDPVKIRTREEFLSEQMKEQPDAVQKMDKMALDEDDDFDMDIDEADLYDDADLEDENAEIDEDEIELEEADQQAIEGRLDQELDRVREEARSVQSMFDEDEDDDLDFDDLDEEDEIDIEEDEDLEDENLSIEEQNQEAAEDEALDADYDEEADEYDEELEGEEDSQESESEEDADTEEDENTEEDSDAEESEADNEEEETRTFEEGDVIQFDADETEQREFLLLDIYPLAKNDKITVYKVYDIEADDNTFRTVRVKQGSNATIEKLAKFVRKMNPKEFTRYYNEMESYEKNPEPITS